MSEPRRTVVLNVDDYAIVHPYFHAVAFDAVESLQLEHHLVKAGRQQWKLVLPLAVRHGCRRHARLDTSGDHGYAGHRCAGFVDDPPFEGAPVFLSRRRHGREEDDVDQQGSRELRHTPSRKAMVVSTLIDKVKLL